MDNLNNTTSVESNNMTYDNLTYSQKDKYDSLFSLFGDATMNLVLNLDGRGENSFTKVVEKVREIERANHATQKYHDALYDAFELGESYTPQEIIGTVAEIRRDLNMDPYTSRIKANCEKDFFGLFIVHNEYDENTDAEKKALRSYKPVCKLKAEKRR